MRCRRSGWKLGANKGVARVSVVETSRLPEPTEPLIRAADGQDADRLFRDYSVRIQAYCRSRLGSREEADDALQTVYLNAWRYMKAGGRPTNSGAWLFAVAHNVCMTRLRTRGRRAAVEDLQESESLDHVALSRNY